MHDRHWTYDRLAASAAKALPWLHCIPASIAEHDAPLESFRRRAPLQNSCNKGYAGKSRQFRICGHLVLLEVVSREWDERNVCKNEETARQLGGLFFQGRIVPTEAKPSKLSAEIL
jgi:hypothetical protein